MRYGLPQGTTSATIFYLPMRDGETTDKSASALAASVPSGASAPSTAPGYYGDALQFGTGSNTSRLEFTGISWAGSFTVEFWAFVESGGSTLSAIARNATTGGEKDVFDLRLSSTSVTARIVDDAAASYTITAAVARAFVAADLMQGNRMMHVRLVHDAAGGFGYLFLDGQMVGKAAHTLGALATASLGPIQVGGEASTTRTSQFIGRLEQVHIRNVADTSFDAMSANLRPDRLALRNEAAVEFDLEEDVQSDSWTADGGGGHYRALTGFTLGTFVVQPGDVVGVASRLSSVTTTYTQVGNVTDLDAASNSYFVDAVNSRLYVSEDPAALASGTILAVQVRVPFATRGLVRGHRWYIPALVAATAGERRMNLWDEALSVGGGGTVSIAAQHASLPTAFGVEEGTGVVWTNMPARMRQWSPHLPWAALVKTFVGVVDAQPDDDGDTLSVRLVAEAGKFHRVRMEGAVCDTDTFPRAVADAIGYVWPTIHGTLHRHVPAKCVDTLPTTVSGQASMIRYKVANHPLTYMRLHYTGSPVAPYKGMRVIDLNVGEFWILGSGGPTTEVWVDCAGVGTPTTPTYASATPVGEFGDPADALTDGKSLIQDMLTRTLGISSSAFDSTWAATAARILSLRRYAEQRGDASGYVGLLSSYLSELITFLYFRLSTEKWAWEDVVKADASDWTVEDIDCIAEQWPVADASRLARRANAKATAYRRDLTGKVFKYDATTLALKADDKYQRKATWDPFGGATAFASGATAKNWITAIRLLLEEPQRYPRLRLSGRFAQAEQFDVLTINTTRRPSAAVARHRGAAITPAADGSVEVLNMPEYPFPATGAAVVDTREIWSPQTHLEYGNSTGLSLAATAGAWTAVDNHMQLWPRATWGGVPTGIAHRFQVRAQRIAGAADTDLQFRIRDLDGGATLATINCSTTLGFQTAVTSFASIPTANARLCLEYQAAAGVTGTLHLAGWQSEEASGCLLSEEMMHTCLWSTGYRTGAACTGASAAVPNLAMGMWDPARFRPGSKLLWLLYADGTGTTTFTVQISTLKSPDTSFGATPLIHFGTIPTSAGFVEKVMTTTAGSTAAAFVPRFTIAAGTGYVYSISCFLLNPYELRTA